MSKIPDKRIEEIKAAEKAATLGPWREDTFPDGEVNAENGCCVAYQICSGAKDKNDDGVANAAFIAMARTAIPELLAEREEREGEIERLEAALAEEKRHHAHDVEGLAQSCKNRLAAEKALEALKRKVDALASARDAFEAVCLEQAERLAILDAGKVKPE